VLKTAKLATIFLVHSRMLVGTRLVTMQLFVSRAARHQVKKKPKPSPLFSGVMPKLVVF